MSDPRRTKVPFLPISAVDCVQPALQHAREQLFTRFRFGQWSRLALVGILAAELHVGGCGNLGRHFPTLHPKRGSEFLTSSAMPSGLRNIIPAYISAHIGQFLGLILVGAFVLMILAFAFTYVSSVFRFILFESVLRRQCSIGEGWLKWRRAGGRFFLWQIVFQIAASLFLAILIGLPLALALAAGRGRATKLPAPGRVITVRLPPRTLASMARVGEVSWASVKSRMTLPPSTRTSAAER